MSQTLEEIEQEHGQIRERIEEISERIQRCMRDSEVTPEGRLDVLQSANEGYRSEIRQIREEMENETLNELRQVTFHYHRLRSAHATRRRSRVGIIPSLESRMRELQDRLEEQRSELEVREEDIAGNNEEIAEIEEEIRATSRDGRESLYIRLNSEMRELREERARLVASLSSLRERMRQAALAEALQAIQEVQQTVQRLFQKRK